MSENTLQRRREAVLETARRIDETASAAMVHFSQAGSMAAELQVAQAMGDLRTMLTPEIMQPIMQLMDTDLGFRTDRDPKQLDRNGKPNTPYHVEVVRDVVIEAKLRGFHTIGNEFNIIAGRMYAAKNGFRRKLTDGKSFPGLTGFRDAYEVPRIVGDKGAIVKCKANWILDGKVDSAEFEFAIKVNSFMGADAIVGKAERKLCKRVHDLISGVHTPDGDVDDVDLANATNITPQSDTPAPKFSKREKTDIVSRSEPTITSPTGSTNQIVSTEMKIKTEPEVINLPSGQATVQATQQPPSDTALSDEPPFDPGALSEAQTALQAFVITHKGTFDTFKRGMSKTTWFQPGVVDAWASFADVPDETATRLLKAKRGFETALENGASN